LDGSNDEPSLDDENVPSKTDKPELKINNSLQDFIEALPHLETIHYGFHLEKNVKTACCICSSAHSLTTWRTTHGIDKDEDICENTPITSQGLLQCCDDKGDKCHLSTTHYL
jgi:hypothetical protein